MTDARLVLVTGCGGAVGRPVCRALQQAGCRVRGLDLQDGPAVDELVVGDIADPAIVERAMRDVAAVIHLAANPHDQPFVQRLVEPNVVGLFHVLDQARQQGVGRVVLASSMQVISGCRGGGVRTPADAAPTNHYALTKLWAEQMGRMYARRGGLEVIAARIAWLPRNDEECRRLEATGAQRSYLSPGDAGRFFTAAVTAPRLKVPDGEPPFVIAFVVGPQPADRPLYDLGTSHDLGYRPQDIYPQGVDFT
jgi:nucleoside-diphosphate-sugar epimerase